VVMFLMLNVISVSGCKADKRVVVYLEKGTQFEAPVDGYFLDKETIMDMGNVIGQGDL